MTTTYWILACVASFVAGLLFDLWRWQRFHKKQQQRWATGHGQYAMPTDEERAQADRVMLGQRL